MALFIPGKFKEKEKEEYRKTNIKINNLAKKYFQILKYSLLVPSENKK